MLELLVAHLAMVLLAPALVSWLGRRAFLVLALAPASAAAYALAWSSRVADGHGPTQHLEWVPGLDLSLTFRLDSLSWLMLLLVGGVGALVLVYCSAYFSASAQGLRRFSATFVGFAGAMVGLVTADDMLLLFVFWELTTVASYVLIGHYAERKASRRAAMQAIVLTTAGGLAMLAGVVVLGTAAGTYRLSEVVAHPPPGTAVTVAIVCILAGAVTKSALVPFHFWLPAAMAAPTPVSAYLHAAAMVKAGVYLVARFAPGYSGLLAWQVVVLVLGCGTLLLGGYRALRQHDLKLVLAFGTVSQLGLIIVLVGLGTRSAALAGLAMVGAHAMFKAALFLVTGVVDAATGTRDLRRLTGVGRRMPLTATAGGLAVASMIGLPPFAGYVAKEAGLESLVHGDGPAWVDAAVLTAVAAGSVLTVAYGLRFFWGAFASKAPRPEATVALESGTAAVEPLIDPSRLHSQSPFLTVPPLVLGVLGLATALVPHLGEHLLQPYAETYPTGEPGHLALWGGFGPVLAITVTVLALGALAWWQRARVEGLQLRWSARWRVPEADAVYRRTMRRLDDSAADVTSVTQRGSLPFYLGVILVVLVALPGMVVILGTSWPVSVRWWNQPVQGLAVLAIVISSILAARARRRLKAVFLAGIAGYGNALLFLLHGAPDLALTQVLVETVTLVVMVLVLRRLPPYFSNRPLARSRWTRLSIGVASGLAVMAFALAAPHARTAAPVSDQFAEGASTYGGGKNVVNVTLVDIRAWDTMGEISVLLVAATGVASLVFIRRRTGKVLRARDAVPAVDGGAPGVWSGGTVDDASAALRRRGTEPGAHDRMRAWLPAGGTLAPQRRSVVFEVVTRLLFHSMVVFALFLLFSGHNGPGGGFAAGLVVGIALTVRYLAGGRYELGEAAPVSPGVLLGSGLFLSVGVGLVALLAGGDALQSVILEWHVPLLGEVHLVTSLFFDVGVFLVVVGLVLDILRSLGAEVDRQIDADARAMLESQGALDDEGRLRERADVPADVRGEGTRRAGT
ncbi:Na+/H+ antiporter subunit A [Luteimicrobium subarcticum]|uniref:Multisubunit sodium/proton antiporter MrpA subunit /multisubunit sodium/proton antiporter MrpB subunit n=1 Tax=Luteimicrobium subarcticum TaxID=620910 RepID=A0A2M8WS27_9MICO|nr:Na+/H+ antiporter subunit A [Luteimicrobium subarcticum]PJI93739.1 multisubunit sodium/proton antiporter MrpA subunit /multisubunit sodium/proton antiporter MrpB subunit [Luteimicrobium subarcticum]